MDGNCLALYHIIKVRKDIDYLKDEIYAFLTFIMFCRERYSVTFSYSYFKKYLNRIVEKKVTSSLFSQGEEEDGKNPFAVSCCFSFPA